MPTTDEMDFDFSPRTVPQSWTDAADEAPGGDGMPLKKTPQVKTPPIRTSLDMFSACVSTVAVSIVTGFAWYVLQLSGVTTPWIAVALGAAIALALRLGGGRPDSQTRAIMALLFYLATASVVIFLVARHNYAELYGSEPGLLDFEQELLHSRLTEPLAIVAWFTGGFASVWISRLLR